jgi:acyl phosphate:glycerol-3-phosphate acyltransferase
LAGYLAGSIPTGFWLVRALRREDIRAVGSGNIGATNVWRTYGARYGLPVMLLDTIKGFVPALLATIYVGHLAGVVAGGAAMLGH